MIFDKRIEIKMTKKMGRGVFLKSTLPKDLVVHVAEVIEFNRKESKIVDKTLLSKYVYDLGRGKVGLALGFGSLFNHSSNDNISFTVKKFSGRWLIVYKTKRKIEAGEQLFINYGYEP